MIFQSVINKFRINANNFACPHLFFGILVILWQFLLIFVSILFFYFVSVQSFLISTILTIFFVFFNGTRMRALGNIIHECCHARFVPERHMNYQIGKFLCYLEFSCFKTYKKDHFSHHKYLGSILLDEDFKVRHKIGLCDKNSLKFKNFMKIIFYPKNWFYLIKSSFDLSNYNKYSLLFYICYCLVLGILISIFGFELIFTFLILPFFTSYQAMKLFSDALDHGGLYFNEKKENKTRNHYFKFSFFNWLFFPRNDCFHLIHHLYPNIPTTKLFLKHIYLMRHDDEYRKRRHCIF
ncbi:MAG: hypothetical protein DCC88_05695 [Spirobacillus cienkowskii]|jgi:fatty acid desaturase|uniref:Fatty acid desaturase domain-containing protein n=1 Tax=Spirobacillus cienkowskii TaxID=495820 RepID=A0A369KNL4_9BACT|nr:MAG: hypothetical protein DCC88_05695 [Spirobacillus cienkowskii]